MLMGPDIHQISVR